MSQNVINLSPICDENLRPADRIRALLELRFWGPSCCMVTPWFSTMFSPRTSEIHRCGQDCQVGKTSKIWPHETCGKHFRKQDENHGIWYLWWDLHVLIQRNSMESMELRISQDQSGTSQSNFCARPTLSGWYWMVDEGPVGPLVRCVGQCWSSVTAVRSAPGLRRPQSLGLPEAPNGVKPLFHRCRWSEWQFQTWGSVEVLVKLRSCWSWT